jgi:hypothetical protein
MRATEPLPLQHQGDARAAKSVRFILAPFQKSLSLAKCDTEICARRRERRPSIFARKSHEVEVEIEPIQPQMCSTVVRCGIVNRLFSDC